MPPGLPEIYIDAANEVADWSWILTSRLRLHSDAEKLIVTLWRVLSRDGRAAADVRSQHARL